MVQDLPWSRPSSPRAALPSDGLASRVAPPRASAESSDASSCRLELKFQGILHHRGKPLSGKGLGMLTVCDKSSLEENQNGSGSKPD